MAIISDIEIRLRADIARLQQDLNGARRSVDTAMAGISGAAKKAMALLAGFGIGLGVSALVHDVVEAQREFDKLNAGLITATGSTENAAKAFAALQSFAASTPFSVAEATEAFIKLRNLGLTPSEAALRSYGNTASAMGKSLNQLIEAVADAATGEFERLKEFGIKSAVTGDQVAFTFKGTTKIVQNNAKDIETYLKRLGEVDFAGGMERRAATLDGAISNLGDSWQATLRKISSGGFGEGVQAGVLALSNALSDLGTILSAVGGAATTEGGQVKEAAGLHQALTGTFKVLAVAGVGVVAAFRDISIQLTALNEIGKSKDLAGIKNALTIADKDLKANDDWLKGKIAAIQGAVDAQAKADAASASSSKDRLAEYAVELTADQKREQAKTALIATEQRITGVNAESLADLKKLDTALKTGAITQDRYNYLKGKLAEQMYASSQAGKDETKQIEKASAAVKQRADLQAILNDRYQDQLAFLHDTNQLNDTDFIVKNGAAQLKALQDQKVAQEDLLALAYRKHQNQVEQATLAGQIAVTQAKIDSQEKKNKQDLEKEEHRLYTLAANNYADLLDSAQQQTKAQEDATRAQKDEIEALGLNSKQVAELTSKRLLDKAAILEQQAAVQDLTDWTGRLGDESRAQAEELRKQAAGGLYKEQLQQAQAFYSSIEQAAHDTFTAIGDDGKSMWVRLRDSGKSIFLEWLYSITVKKWIVQIGASISGDAAVAGIAGSTASGLAGATSSLTSAASALSSIYSVATGGGLGTGFLGSLTGGLNGAGAGSGLTSSLGLSIGNTIADTLGPTISTALSTGLTGLATALPWAAAAVGIYSLAKAAFGMGDKQYADTSTLSGTLSNSSFTGDVATAYTQKGGWFRSDKSGVDKTAVDAALASTLGATYQAITDASAGYAKVLGLSADSITTRTQSLSIALGKDDAANQAAITAFFSGVSDTIAQELVPNIAQFTAAGETASTTLQRLVVDYQAIDVLMATMGITSTKSFGAVGLAAIAAREDLIALAGGLTNLATQMQFISDNFITTASKAAIARGQVTDTMNAISGTLAMFGYSAIKTTDQYTYVVQDLASSGALALDSGRQLYETLLALAPAFKTVSDYATEAKAAANDNASAALDALSKAVDAQKTIVTDAYNTAMDALESRITDLGTSITTLTRLSTALKGAMASVDAPGAGAASRASAQAQITAALAIAKASGVLPSQDSIADALATLKQDSSDQFATLADYQRSVAQSNAAIEALGGLTDGQLSTAQQQLDLLQAQKDDLTAANTAQLARLDSLVTAAQSQINAVNGINDSVLTIGQALIGVYFAANQLSGFSGISATEVSTSNASAGSIFDSAAVAELRALNDRIARMEASAAATAAASAQFASQFNNVSAGGNTLLVETA